MHYPVLLPYALLLDTTLPCANTTLHYPADSYIQHSDVRETSMGATFFFAPGQATLFSAEHAASFGHLENVALRDAAIATRKQLELENNPDSAVPLNVALAKNPSDKNPEIARLRRLGLEFSSASARTSLSKTRPDARFYRIISKYDECYRWTWVPTIRCDLCGDQHDQEFTWGDCEVCLDRHSKSKRHKALLAEALVGLEEEAQEGSAAGDGEEGDGEVQAAADGDEKSGEVEGSAVGDGDGEKRGEDGRERARTSAKDGGVESRAWKDDDWTSSAWKDDEWAETSRVWKDDEWAETSRAWKDDEWAEIAWKDDDWTNRSSTKRTLFDLSGAEWDQAKQAIRTELQRRKSAHWVKVGCGCKLPDSL